MLRNVIAIIVACYISCYQCDNRYNDRYNELVNRGSLKKSIDSQLPKESKFFDMNDFDCKYEDLSEVIIRLRVAIMKEWWQIWVWEREKGWQIVFKFIQNEIKVVFVKMLSYK